MTARENAPLHVAHLESGELWEVELGGSRGNVLDHTLVTALTDVFHQASRRPRPKAVCLHGKGGHFSFGASVAEHLPEEVHEMLPRFHGLFRAMAESAVICLAAVRGQCLGGGLELASLCHRVLASPDAKLGQPEIALGVFAPLASLLLAERVGRPSAEDLCLTGRIIDADEALRIGLVDGVVEDPEDELRAYFRKHLRPKSARSLELAVRALRSRFDGLLGRELDELEHLYLDELMTTEDATEGLRAFLEKREPVWRNR
jgi:cyclohexa-1,5-dienecarbonyl-CoA hydratase